MSRVVFQSTVEVACLPNVGYRSITTFFLTGMALWHICPLFFPSRGLLIGANHRDAANDRMLRCCKVGKGTIPQNGELQNRLIDLEDKLLTHKRSIIETIVDQLKNISQMALTLHRSIRNFVVNLLAGLIYYTWQPKKAALLLSDKDLALLPALT